MLVGYFIENSDAGSAAERQQFSDDLFDSFDGHIVEACAAATPPLEPTPRIRASIALMAQHSPGATSRVQARRAVAAYLTFRGF
jgi:hypothetical protein